MTLDTFLQNSIYIPITLLCKNQIICPYNGFKLANLVETLTVMQQTVKKIDMKSIDCLQTCFLYRLRSFTTNLRGCLKQYFYSNKHIGSSKRDFMENWKRYLWGCGYSDELKIMMNACRNPTGNGESSF